MTRRWPTAFAGIIFLTVLSPRTPAASIKTDRGKNNQTLNLPKDPPLVSVGETSRLMFHVSPLSGEGLLSQQTRNALKAILKLTKGATIVHIRAFAAGNGDIRRIPQIVSDLLGDKHTPLPSVSVLQVGALPLGGAQVVLETVSLDKKTVNKDGLTFYPGETAMADGPGVTVKALLEKSIGQLAAKMNGKPALSVTCLVSDLDDAPGLQRILASRFPGAVTDLVQSRRVPWRTDAVCEGISHGGNPAVQRLAFSGTQLSFGEEEKDVALAMRYLDRALTGAGAPRAGNAGLLRLYLLSPAIAGAVLKQIAGSAPVTSFSVEDIGSIAAGFAIDTVSPVR